MNSLNIFLFSLITFACYGQKQDTLFRYYKGKVNREYSITMELMFVENSLNGQYIYDKYRDPVRLVGELRDSNSLILWEMNDKGMSGGTFFSGSFSEDHKTVNGVWVNNSDDERFVFNFSEVAAGTAGKDKSEFENIIQFQQLLNYFDLQISLPFNAASVLDLKSTEWENYEEKTSATDYNRLIPYHLAKRFVMNKVSMKGEGNFNYFRIKNHQYSLLEMHYRSLCSVYRTADFVSLLFHFKEDTGWDSYNVVFMLNFDYAGHLIDGRKIYKDLDLEYNGKEIKEFAESTFLEENSFIIRSKKNIQVYNTEASVNGFYRKKELKEDFYYKIRKDGKIILQKGKSAAAKNNFKINK